MNRPLPWSTEYLVIAKSIRAAGDRLLLLPRSPQVVALETVIRAVQDDTARWSKRPPRHGDHQAILTKLLAIHLAVAALKPRAT
jgi:hypothetical protein